MRRIQNGVNNGNGEDHEATVRQVNPVMTIDEQKRRNPRNLKNIKIAIVNVVEIAVITDALHRKMRNDTKRKPRKVNVPDHGQGADEGRDFIRIP